MTEDGEPGRGRPDPRSAGESGADASVAIITGDWIRTSATRAVLDALEADGARVLFVGGCVRNDILGLPVGDLDLATDALPDRVAELARKAGLKTVPTGIDHGTVTVFVDGAAFEVTTFRRDIETDGRHAKVAFSDNVEDDARRRDFTMNALYADRAGTVIDPLGQGISDLRARVLRFVGNPRDRLREDRLRALRYFRFHAWYAREFSASDEEALFAIREAAPGLSELSRERVTAELLRLLAAPNPFRELEKMERLGILAELLPVPADASREGESGSGARSRGPARSARAGEAGEAGEAKEVSGAWTEPFRNFAALETAAGLSPEPIRRLALLGGAGIREELRLTRSQKARHARLRSACLGAWSPAETGYRLGAEGVEVMVLKFALEGAGMDQAVLDEVRHGASQRFPVKAVDLSAELEGKALGDMLRELEQAWIDSGFALGREQLLVRAKADGVLRPS